MKLAWNILQTLFAIAAALAIVGTIIGVPMAIACYAIVW
jgi:hypothetical protein